MQSAILHLVSANLDTYGLFMFLQKEMHYASLNEFLPVSMGVVHYVIALKQIEIVYEFLCSYIIHVDESATWGLENVKGLNSMPKLGFTSLSTMLVLTQCPNWGSPRYPQCWS